MNIWRKFESEQSFVDWHEQSKQLLNMPIVGVRASDGVPQPDKQQTTDYTALTYQNLEVDSDGEPIIPETPPLDAVVADDSIIEQVSGDAQRASVGVHRRCERLGAGCVRLGAGRGVT